LFQEWRQSIERHAHQGRKLLNRRLPGILILLALATGGCSPATSTPTILPSASAAASDLATPLPRPDPTQAPASPVPSLTAAPSPTVSPSPSLDLAGLKVEEPFKLETRKGMAYSFPKLVTLTNERLDAGALVEITFEGADGTLLSMYGEPGGARVFVPPNWTWWPRFLARHAKTTVTPVIKSVTWLRAPAAGAYESVSYRSYAKDCKEKNGALSRCRISNKNPYPISVVPMIARVAKDNTVVALEVAGPAQVMKPGTSWLKFDPARAMDADRWVAGKSGRALQPWWTFATDQPAFKAAP
jgi:hypothetical protein